MYLRLRAILLFSCTRGEQGIVRLGIEKISGKKVAIKTTDVSDGMLLVVNLHSLSDKTMRAEEDSLAFKKEVKLLKSLKHKNIITLIDAIEDERYHKSHMILELCAPS